MSNVSQIKIIIFSSNLGVPQGSRSEPFTILPYRCSV